MRRRTRRPLKKRLKIVLILVLLGVLSFALPYLWSVVSSSPDLAKEPKAEDLAKG